MTIRLRLRTFLIGIALLGMPLTMIDPRIRTPERVLRATALALLLAFLLAVSSPAWGGLTRPRMSGGPSARGHVIEVAAWIGAVLFGLVLHGPLLSSMKKWLFVG
jgi:putative copper export protein